MSTENDIEVQKNEQAQQAFDEMFADATQAYNDFINTFWRV